MHLMSNMTKVDTYRAASSKPDRIVLSRVRSFHLDYGPRCANQMNDSFIYWRPSLKPLLKPLYHI